MVGVETTDGLYKSVVSVCGGMVKLTKDSKSPEWHAPLGRFNNDITEETLPNVTGIT